IYNATDGSTTDNATVIVHVNPRPVAVDDEYTATSGSKLIIDAAEGVLANDSAEGAAVAAAATTPAHGSLALNADGSFSYTAADGYAGTDSFTYTVSDGIADSGTATVVITVESATPAAPVLSASPNGEYADLSWVPGDAGSVDYFTVDISADGGGTWTYLQNITGTYTSWSYRLGYNTAASFRIKALLTGTSLWTDWSGTASATTLPQPSITSMTGGTRQVSLDWAMPGTVASDATLTGWEVQWTADYPTFSDSLTLDADATTTTITGLPLGTNIYAEVRALSGATVTGPWSIAATAPTDEHPAAPAIASVTPDGDNLDVVWTPGDDSQVQYYLVESSSDDGLTWTTLSTTAETSCQAYAGYGTTLAFRVSALSGTSWAWSATSAVVSGTTLPQPVITEMTGGVHLATLSWGMPDGVSAAEVTGWEVRWTTDYPNFGDTTMAYAAVTTSGTISGLATRSNVYAEVRARYDGGTPGPWSAPRVASTDPHPAAPTITSVTPDDYHLNVTWEPGDNDPVWSYLIEASSDGGATWWIAGAVMAPQTSFGAYAGYGATRMYRVYTEGASGYESLPSEAVSGSTLPVPTITLTGGDRSVSVSWALPDGASPDGITGWEVSWTTDYPNFTDSTTLAADASSHVITGLAGGVTVYVRVRAVYGTTDGPWSEAATAYPTAPVNTITAPDVVISHPGGSALSVSAADGLLAGVTDSDPAAILRVTGVSGSPWWSSMSWSADGSYTWHPYYASNHGETADGSYTVTDSSGFTATGTIHFEQPFSCTDDTAGATAGVSAILNATVTCDWSSNYTYSIATPPSQGTTSPGWSTQFNYTPDATATGTDTIVVRVTNGVSSHDHTITITIAPNQPPTASDGSYRAIADGRFHSTYLQTLGQLVSDPEWQDPSITIATAPAHGSAAILDVTTGDFTYTPDAGFTGSDTFTYTDTDPAGNTATGSVTMNVTGQNAPPDGGTLHITILQGSHEVDFGADTNLTPQLFPFTDPDGDVVRITGETAPEHGTLGDFNGGPILVADPLGMAYTVDPSYAGEDHFSLTLADGGPVTSTLEVTVTVLDIADSTITCSWGSGTWQPCDQWQSVSIGQVLDISAADGLGNGLSLPGDPADWALRLQGVEGGTATVAPDGAYSFTPGSQAGYGHIYAQLAYQGTVLANTRFAVWMQINPPALTAPEQTLTVAPGGSISADTCETGLLAAVTGGYGPYGLDNIDTWAMDEAGVSLDWSWDGTYTLSATADAATGTYDLPYTVYDDDENGADGILHVVVAWPPVASFATDTTEGPAPLAVQFTDTSTDATSWHWEFGDGTSSEDQSPSHTFTDAGDYSATLTVTGPGGTDTSTTTISATASALATPSVTSVTPRDGYLDVTWAPGDETPVDSYIIELSRDGGDSWTIYGYSASLSDTIMVGSGATVAFRVTATTNAGRSSEPSAPMSGTTLPQPSITSMTGGTKAVSLEWALPDGASSDGITGWEVQWATREAWPDMTTLAVDAGTTTATITGLPVNTNIYARVRAVAGTVSGEWTEFSYATTDARPAAPVNPSVTPDRDYLDVAWTPGDDAEVAFYTVEWSLDGGDTWATYAHTSDTSVQVYAGYGVSLAFRVTTNSAGGYQSDPSAAVSGTTLPQPSITGATGGAKTISLVWALPDGASSDGITGWEVQWTTSYPSFDDRVTLDADASSYDITGLPDAAYVAAEVRALYGEADPGPWSVAAWASTDPTPIVPPTVTVTPDGVWLDVAWAPGDAHPVSYYRLETTDDDGVSWHAIAYTSDASYQYYANVGSAARSFRVSTLTSDTWAWSAPSESVSGATYPYPTITTATGGHRSIDLAWSLPEGSSTGTATGWEVRWHYGDAWTSSSSTTVDGASAGALTIDGLTDDTYYQCEIRLTGPDGAVGLWSSWTAGQTLPPTPAAPTITSVVPDPDNGDYLDVTWTPGDGIAVSYYLVETSSDGGKTWTQGTDIDGTSARVHAGYDATLAVRVTTLSTRSAWSEPSAAVSGTTHPLPSIVSMTGGAKSVSASWALPAGATTSGVTGWEVRWTTNQVDYTSVTTAAGTLSTTISGLPDGTSVSAQVRARYGDAAPGPWSDAASATTNTALAVTRAGTGSGTVTSSPAGINCGSTCSSTFSYGTSVTLTATPATGSTFTGWSGACSGTGTCTLVMSANRAATATFALDSRTLAVTRAGTGSGTVTSSPA
ncbi:MAG: fibronectin type III domain-containing protein, partial [Chloroflexota bacterium]